MVFEYVRISEERASRLAFICQSYSEFFKRMIVKPNENYSKHYLDGILQGIRLTLAASENLRIQFNDEYVYLVDDLSGQLILKYDRSSDNESVEGEYHEA